MDQLTFRIYRDDDGAVELSVEATLGKFAGQGSAWLADDSVMRFCESLDRYPLQPDQLPEISGGIWDQDAKRLSETHLRVAVSRYDLRGNLLLEVHLAESQDTERNLTRSMDAWRLITYADAQRLSSTFRSLMNGARNEATLLFE